MNRAIAATLPDLEQARREIRSAKGAQIFSAVIRGHLHSLATRYFDQVRPEVSGIEDVDAELREADAIFQELHALSRKNASKDKCLRLLKSAKAVFVRLEGAALSRGARHTAGTRTTTDSLIIESLQDVCPTAALSYSQALQDLESDSRLSYRGPATDLREALRETLDKLAPDKEVEGMPGYKAEADAKRPTMKQKVRYILRSRGFGSGQLAAPESAVEGVEEMLGGVVRSVYTRSSVSTHTATTRTEVLRVVAWVRLVLCELLEVPN